MERIEQFLITAVSSVGVSINQVIPHRHMHGLLQFVCGLGPRKAEELLRALAARASHGDSSMVESRAALRKLMTAKVFENCCAFLRIQILTDQGFTTDIAEPLDSTRIHPSSYDISWKLAQHARCLFSVSLC